MHLSLYDPQEALENMVSQVEGYARAAFKRRGRKPYISALLIDTNAITTRVIDGHVGDEERHGINDVLVRAHYPGGESEYALAFTPSPRQLHFALMQAEDKAFSALRDALGVRLLQPDHPALQRHLDLDVMSAESLTYNSLSSRLAECEGTLASTQGIVSSQALLEVYIGREIFCDSLGRRTIQDFNRMYVYLAAAAACPDMPHGRFELEEIVACSGKIKDLDDLFLQAVEVAAEVSRKTVSFARAKRGINAFRLGLKRKRYDVVLSGAMAGVTNHEVGPGHLAEADRFLKEPSTGVPFDIGEEVGIASLNIVDHPQWRFHKTKPPSYYQIDHEGVFAGAPTYLVKNGRFDCYMTSKRSAGTLPQHEIRRVLTGNARLGKVARLDEVKEVYYPIAPESRMSTLVLLPNPQGPSLPSLLDQVAGRGLFITTGWVTAEVHTETAQGKVAINEVYFVTKGRELVPVRIPGHRLFLVDDAMGWMGKIKLIGNASTLGFESSWCESYSGDVPQSSGGAAIYAEGVKFLPVKIQVKNHRPFVPIPSRKHVTGNR